MTALRRRACRRCANGCGAGARKRRPLFRDEKILTAPNALAIQTLCRAYEATGRELYREAAEKAAQFLFERMQLAQGIMAGCFGQGELRPGTLEDTAQTAVAALALYSATLHGGWLDHAVALARSLLRHLWPQGRPGFT